MSRIRRKAPYIIKRFWCNQGYWPLSKTDNTKAFNYGCTVWSNGDVEVSGTCLEHRVIPLPFPIWSEYVQGGETKRIYADYAINLTQILYSASGYEAFVDALGISPYSFVAKVHSESPDANNTVPLYFILRGVISKKILDFIASGGTFLNSDGTFPLTTLQNIVNGYTFDIDSGSWVAPQS